MTTWRLSEYVDLLGATTERISTDHTRRQRDTAHELLERFTTRPGQILADEVGLGKTYTALAVAASVALENPEAGPVVIMVPAGLQEKWPIEWSVFEQLYLRGRRLRTRQARDGVEFLRVLDDAPHERADLVFLAHGAFRRQMRDRWVKLALVRQVLVTRRMPREWNAVVKFGAAVVGEGRLDDRHLGLVADLFAVPPARWRGVLTKWGLDPGDDPVPQALLDALRGLDVSPLLDALRELPSNRSKHADIKVKGVAAALNHAIGKLWEVWLRRTDFRSPLLILDEAHHAKNRSTQLASLFENEASEGGTPGALMGRFERMLFLTATPFQLGHHELIEVLHRFGAVDWSTLPGSRDAYLRELGALSSALSAAQRATLRLDERWSRLRSEDVPARDRWWLESAAEDHDRVTQIRRAFAGACGAMRAGETQLRPWVVRHRKPDAWDDGTPRRDVLRGAQIIDRAQETGIDIDSAALLPFLLAGRAQVAFQRAQAKGQISSRARSLFADGLCSSFEAYHDTRDDVGGGLDEEAASALTTDDSEVEWYLDAISNALASGHAAGAEHPKVAATVHRAVALWHSGEKVVVFCHFRKTGSALRRHISNAIDRELRQTVAAAFDVPTDDVPRRLELIAQRLYVRADGRSPLAREADRELRGIVSTTGTEAEREQLVEVLLRFLRSPVTLGRYGAPLADERTGSIAAVLDASRAGGSLRQRFSEFVRFFDTRIAEERQELLAALLRVQVGQYHADPADLDGEDLGDERELLLPTVRLANGLVRRDARRRLLLAFNSPLLPEVLVASSVLAEGVDLHLECRHVIHHDLDWNPSTLEQRTGRIDRIGSLAARTASPISIYLPYLAATQDEKMYRVVRDRERWFQVVMGAKHELDEAALQHVAERVELPEEAARELAFDLKVSGP